MVELRWATIVFHSAMADGSLPRGCIYVLPVYANTYSFFYGGGGGLFRTEKKYHGIAAVTIVMCAYIHA